MGIPCRAQNDCQEVLQGKKSWRILLSFYICIFPVSSWLLVQTIYDLILMLLKLQLSYFWQSTNYAIGCSLKLSKPFIKNINKIYNFWSKPKDCIMVGRQICITAWSFHLVWDVGTKRCGLKIKAPWFRMSLIIYWLFAARSGEGCD